MAKELEHFVCCFFWYDVYMRECWLGGEFRQSTCVEDSLSQHKFDFPHPKPGTNKFNVVFVGNLPKSNAKFMWSLCLICSSTKILFGGFCVSKYNGILSSLFRKDCSVSHSRIQTWPHGPQGIQEEFNYRRLTLHRVVERRFEVLKVAWKIVDDKMSQMSLESQIKIVIAVCILHNIVLLHEKGM